MPAARDLNDRQFFGDLENTGRSRLGDRSTHKQGRKLPLTRSPRRAWLPTSPRERDEVIAWQRGTRLAGRVATPAGVIIWLAAVALLVSRNPGKPRLAHLMLPDAASADVAPAKASLEV
jgi:hypothetical protein